MRLNSLSITYILAPAPTLPSPQLCCTCREKLFTQATKLAGLTLLVAQRQFHRRQFRRRHTSCLGGCIIPHLPGHGSFIAQGSFFLVWLIFTTVFPPHTSPVSFQSFVLQHLMLRQKAHLSLPGFLARCLAHKSSLVSAFYRRSPCPPNASLPP
jgi:hypothetical protein